jgi:sulfite reductase alpha subunit-like flavoprotein
VSIVDVPRYEMLPTPAPAAPARAVLERAEALRDQLGHENLGFLSARRGFAPHFEPARRLPAEFGAWDEAAARLPELYRSLRLRRELDSLPLLDAGPDSLPDKYLLRAALVIGFLAQSYWRVEIQPAERLPAALQRPWAQVRARLGRPEQTVSVIDLLYNWQTIDGRPSDELKVEKLDLLVPTVGTRDERVFYLTPLEILAQATPMVLAMVRAHEAVSADDPWALETELVTLLETMESLDTPLAHINPHPDSATHVDPVIWAKTVAPLVVPIKNGDQGPSGTASPIFLALDAFLGRKQFDTYLGREMRHVRSLYPPLWREFLDALDRVSVTRFVAQCDNPTLTELLRQLVDSYVGPEGFLARHRIKVRGYLELAFKVGRSITITGFQGAFTDRTWEAVDNELELARRERAPELSGTYHRATVKQVVHHAPGGADEIVDVVLDISDLPLRYRPGDRCCVLPENTDEMVDRTLRALGLNGDERVELTEQWRDAVRLRRSDDQPVNELSARELLQYGRIRPVSQATARALLRLLGSDDWLTGLVREGGADRFELWDLLGMLRRHGLDGVPAHALCEVVPPMGAREYSISSATTPLNGELRLTVARVRYSSVGLDREGTASTFLATASPGTSILVQIARSPRFKLPGLSSTPIVMIAGGSGIAPFRAFVAERMRTLSDAGPAWLLFGQRTNQDVLDAADLATARRRGMLHVDVALSRPAAGPARRITDLIEDPHNAKRLVELVRRGAQVYVCGGQGFTQTALHSLERAVGASMIERLTAQGRLGLEAFAGHDAERDRAELGWSQIAMHNNERNGRWLVLDGQVFDVEPFLRRHPGGTRIIRSWAGTDATAAFDSTHHGRGDVMALRELLVIGRVRPAELPVHRAWVAVLQLVTEMQNALANDQEMIHLTTTRDDPAPHRSPYNLQRSIETHERFLRTHLDVLLDQSFQNLWAVTMSCLDQPHEPSWMQDRVAALRERDDARRLEAAVVGLYGVLDEHIDRQADFAPGLMRACRTLLRHDNDLLDAVKTILGRTVAVFEDLGHRCVNDAAAPLLSSCEALITAVTDYHTHLNRALHDDRDVAAMLGRFEAATL